MVVTAKRGYKKQLYRNGVSEQSAGFIGLERKEPFEANSPRESLLRENS